VLLILTPPLEKLIPLPTLLLEYLFLSLVIFATVITKGYFDGYPIVDSFSLTPLCLFPPLQKMAIPASWALSNASLLASDSVSLEKEQFIASILFLIHQSIAFICALHKVLFILPLPLSILTAYNSHPGATPRLPLLLSCIPITPATLVPWAEAKFAS